MAVTNIGTGGSGAIGTGTSVFGPFDKTTYDLERLKYELEMQKMQAAMHMAAAEAKQDANSFQFHVTKAENGHVLRCNGKQYVMTSIDELADGIKALMVQERMTSGKDR